MHTHAARKQPGATPAGTVHCGAQPACTIRPGDSGGVLPGIRDEMRACAKAYAGKLHGDPARRPATTKSCIPLSAFLQRGLELQGNLA